ncbi:MAG: MATE family efflux transporter [Aristaeellaceae bacterium]
MSNEEMLRSGSFSHLAMKLCLPAILIMLVTVLYHMADVLFVGRMGDANKVAAVSLASPLFTILSGFGVLLGNGGCTAISLALGQADYGRVKKISAFCFWTAMAIGIVFMAGVLAFMQPLCRILGANADTLQFTMDYLAIIALGAPVIMLTNVLPSLIRADGSTLNSMIGNLTGTVLNIVLDPLLILTLQLGVRGAALATVAANAVALVYYLYFMVKKSQVYSVNPRHYSLDGSVALRTIMLGLPMCCSTILMSVSSTVANNLMMTFGTVAVSAQKVASTIGMLVSMVVMGICMGMQPAVSFNYSAGNRKRLIDILQRITAMAVLGGAALAIVSILFRDQLLGLFLKGADDSFLAIGRVCLLASVVTGPLLGFYQISTMYLQATGKSKKAILVSLLEKGLVYIPAMLLMKLVFGLYGVVFAATVTTVISAIVALYYCYHDFRKELKQQGGLTHEA